MLKLVTLMNSQSDSVRFPRMHGRLAGWLAPHWYWPTDRIWRPKPVSRSSVERNADRQTGHIPPVHYTLWTPRRAVMSPAFLAKLAVLSDIWRHWTCNRAACFQLIKKTTRKQRLLLSCSWSIGESKRCCCCCWPLRNVLCRFVFHNLRARQKLHSLFPSAL